MPIKFEDQNDGIVLAIQVLGKLIKADYVCFSAEFERLVSLNVKLRMLFDIQASMDGKQARYGKISNSTLNTSPTLNGLR
jgi:hypothetical protein